MKPLAPHHIAWLGAHQERSSCWLRAQLRDGFDVHHLDGDHGNNDPINLVLIDGADHMMIHNGKSRFSRIGFVGRRETIKRDNSATRADMRALKKKSRERHRAALRFANGEFQ